LIIAQTGAEKRETQDDVHPPASEAEQQAPPEEVNPEAMQIDTEAALDNEAPEQGPQRPPSIDPEAAYAYPTGSGDVEDDDGKDEDNEEQGKGVGSLHNFHALPPELAFAPPGECDPEVQARVVRWLVLQRDGRRLTDTLRSSKDYRNPEFFKKMVEYWEIDEHGTAFTPDMFDPRALPQEDSIEELKKELAAAEQKKKAERAAGTSKIDFTKGSGAAQGNGGGASSSAAARATAAAIKAAQAMAQKLAANRGR
jgi:hypothetical protein